MEAVAHNPSFAKKAGVPQSVGQDFSKADKGKTFKRGGEMATKMDPKMMAMMMKKKSPMAPAAAAAPAAPMGGMGGMGMKKGGMAAFEKSGKDVEKKGMKEGSKADMALDKKQMGMKKGGMTKMAGGGLAGGHKSADGIASKGKTKGMNVAMKRGGKIC
jgi:hypothetical protein